MDLKFGVFYYAVILFSIIVLSNSFPHPINLGSALAGGQISVLKDEREFLDENSNYRYDIELSDGTKLEQEGHTEPPGPGDKEGGSLVVKGSYSYNSPDGNPVHVSYTADKGGFKPKTESG